MNRFKWYYFFEKAHAFFTFPVLIIYSLYKYPVQNIIFLTYGLIVCMFILIQGQYYWKIKYFKLKEQPLSNPKNLSFFKNCKKINLILICAMPVVFVLQMWADGWNSIANDLLPWAIYANLFAVLEHINYYNIQLMIDNKHDLKYLILHKRFKKSHLSKDLDHNTL